MLRLICLLSDIVVQDSISSTEELFLSTSTALGKVDSYTYSGNDLNKDGGTDSVTRIHTHIQAVISTKMEEQVVMLQEYTKKGAFVALENLWKPT